MGFVDGLLDPVSDAVDDAVSLPEQALEGTAAAVGSVASEVEQIGGTALQDAEMLAELPLKLLGGVEGTFSWLPILIIAGLGLAAFAEYEKFEKK